MRSLLLLFVLGACGGGGGGSISLDRMPRAYAELLCDKLYSCCDAAEREESERLYGFTDEASCLPKLEEVYQRVVDDRQEQIDAGKLRYDAGANGTCLANAREATCTEFGADNYDCPEVFIGLVQDGQICNTSLECAGGNCEDGTCAQAPGQGQPCSFDCADDLVCAAGTCQPPKEAGEACGTGDECRSRECQGTCVEDTTCNGT